MTSSVAAIMRVSPDPQILSESDWNDQSIQEVEKSGKDAANGMKYQASKTLAEKGEPPR